MAGARADESRDDIREKGIVAEGTRSTSELGSTVGADGRAATSFEIITPELIQSIYPESHVRQASIEEEHVDDEGSLRLGYLMQKMQQMENDQCEDIGIGYSFLDELNLTWIYVNAYYAFHQAFPHQGDDVILETWMHPSKGIRFLRENAYYTSEGLWGSSSGEWLLVDRDTRKPARPKDVIKAGNLDLPVSRRRELKKPSGMRRLRTSESRPDVEPSLSYLVPAQDIDLNNHLNNTIYVDLMMEVFKEWAGPHFLRACQFSFLREVFQDETLEYFITGDGELEIQGELWDLARLEAWVEGKDEAAFVSQVAYRKKD